MLLDFFTFPVLHSCTVLGSRVLHSSQGAVLDSQISLEGSHRDVAGLCEGTEGAALQLAHRTSGEGAVWAGMRAFSAVQEGGQ